MASFLLSYFLTEKTFPLETGFGQHSFMVSLCVCVCHGIKHNVCSVTLACTLNIVIFRWAPVKDPCPLCHPWECSACQKAVVIPRSCHSRWTFPRIRLLKPMSLDSPVLFALRKPVRHSHSTVELHACFIVKWVSSLMLVSYVQELGCSSSAIIRRSINVKRTYWSEESNMRRIRHGNWFGRGLPKISTWGFIIFAKVSYAFWLLHCLAKRNHFTIGSNQAKND